MVSLSTMQFKIKHLIVELEVQSRGPSQVPSQIGQKTFLPLGEMDLEQTLKLVMHPHPTPTPPWNF